MQGFGHLEDALSPDSVINTWELMEGVDEEEFHYHMVEPINKNGEIEIDGDELDKSYEFVEHPVSKPLRRHLSEESLLACGEFEKGKETEIPQKIQSLESDSDESCCLPGGRDRVVLYYTSLRGIRKTYEDSCAVRAILRCFGVCVDERDTSMDMSYRAELQEAFKGRAVSLPQMFIKGMHIGGAEEIKLLHDAGELGKLLESFPMTEKVIVCEACGDARFVPCRNCRGSRKVYEGGEDGKLRRCSYCNENGLVRCSGCCS